MLTIGEDEIGPLLYPTYERRCGEIVARAEETLTAGPAEVEEVPLVVPFDYASFDDYWYWATFLSGQGRSGSYVMSLDGATREALRGHVRAAYLAGMADGPRSFSVIVRAARGRVPGQP